MKKNYFLELFFLLLLISSLFTVNSCRQEALFSEKSEDFNIAGANFKIRKAAEIPRVVSHIKSQTKRNDLKIVAKNSLQKNSSFGKGNDSINVANLQTDFIVEKYDGDITYYVFNIENMGDDKTIYNLEIKEAEGVIERTKIIEYSSENTISDNPAEDFLYFTGTVTSYDMDGNMISSREYVEGNTTNECSSGDGNSSSGGTGFGGVSGGGDGETGTNPGSGGFWFFNGGFYYNTSGSNGSNGSGSGSGGSSSSGNSENGCDPASYVVLEVIYNQSTGEPMGELIMDGCGVIRYQGEFTISPNRGVSERKPLRSDCVDTSAIIIINADSIFRQYIGSIFPQYLMQFLAKPENNAFYEDMKAYFYQQGGSAQCRENLLKGAAMKYKKQHISWESFLKWETWSYNYLGGNYQAEVYYNANPDDLQYIFFDDIDSNDWEFANESANVITDILINQQNGTLNNLDISWPSLEELKQQVKNAISKGVYTSAKYVRDYMVIPLSKYANNNPNKINWINTNVIDKIRTEAVTPLVNFNPNTMGWGDLFNIWLFELTPGHFPNNTINYTNASNVITGNNIYNPATNAVKNFPKGNTGGLGVPLNIQNKLANGLNVGQTATGFFHYHTDAFYSTLANANLGIQMLGSFSVKATVLSKSTNSAVVEFYIYNFLGWDSATRFIKGQNGSGNQGVIDDKDVGAGLHLGGTIKNNFTWTETVNF